jgi:GAF domain-containing protein
MAQTDRTGDLTSDEPPEPLPPLGPVDVTHAEVFARLAVEMHDAEGVEETIDSVVQFALQALDCSYAGVALSTRGGPEIPAVTDPLVAKIYQIQLETGDGPLVATMRDQVTTSVRDTTTESRWPAWAAEVYELGVRSVLDVPLLLGPDSATVGVLGLYSRIPDGFSAEDEAIAHILARHATVAVASARNERNLAAAADARKVVGQAMGILMERFEIDADRAFAVLKRYSQDNNTKLRDVASQLINTRTLPR